MKHWLILIQREKPIEKRLGPRLQIVVSMVQADLRTLIKQERERRRKQTAILQADQADTFGHNVQLLKQKALAQSPIDLATFRIGSDRVQGLIYVPNFLTADEEASVVGAIEAAPSSRWIRAGERSIQNWGGKPGNAEIVEELPPFLLALVDRLVSAGVFARHEAPNHCLINEYAAGAGITPHQDGPLYLDRVATITLAGPALISLHRAGPDGSTPGSLVTTVMLREGGLFIVEGEAYTSCMHSIASTRQDSIAAHCCNRHLSGVAVGEVVSRAERRFSLVFVHKKQTPH